MGFRYTDLDARVSEYRDFVPRRRFPTITELFIICAAVMLFAVTLSVTVTDRLALVGALLVAGGGICLYTLRHVKQSRDLLYTTELQNALLGASLGIGCAFYVITRKDGTILHCNRPFQDFYRKTEPGQSLTIEEWAAHQGWTKEQRAGLTTAMSGRGQQLRLALRDSDNRIGEYTIFIEPLPRPAGIALLRARDASQSS